MINVYAVLVSIVGLIIYLVIQHPKVSDVGRIMFFVGLLVFLLYLTTGGRMWHLPQ